MVFKTKRPSGRLSPYIRNNYSTINEGRVKMFKIIQIFKLKWHIDILSGYSKFSDGFIWYLPKIYVFIYYLLLKNNVYYAYRKENLCNIFSYFKHLGVCVESKT